MRGLKPIASAAFAAVLALGFAGAGHAQDYVLGEGDLVRITVYENEDLTTVTRVSGDGMISVPLIGKMQAAGTTPSEAEQRLTELLSDGFLVDPHVSVFVEEYRSKRVTILGEVVKPGLYELNGNATVLEIISKAGGLTEKAGSTLAIKRKRAGGDVQADSFINIDLREMMEKGDLSSDMYVQDGDNIFVTKSGFVYVTGEVKKPGAYKYEDGMTVMKAIALAEGLTERASPGRTALVRKEGGEEKSFKVEMGFQVRPDDLISVPESFF